METKTYLTISTFFISIDLRLMVIVITLDFLLNHKISTKSITIVENSGVMLVRWLALDLW